MAYLGISLLTVALLTAFHSLILASGKTKGQKNNFFSEQSTTISALAVLGASLILIYAFLSDNFSFAYVARNSRRSLPLIYKLSALWAGQSGSLLLWLLIVSCFGVVVQKNKKLQEQNLAIKVNFIVNIMRLLFLILLIFITSPFETYHPAPFDGQGLNPMLQSLGMVIHPPILFIGFTGFLIPFALVVVCLWERRETDIWVQLSRPWVLFAWLFLTAGIITGGQWAYNELGWGGYWAWDPVENSSLFPWLTATALLHSFLLPKKDKQSLFVDCSLIVLTFWLTIFSTFLTRSGILDSVHAFAGGILGTIFFMILVFIALFSFYLAWTRRSLLLLQTKNEATSDWVFNKKTAIKGGNILLCLIALGVFVGTLFPLISRFFIGQEIVLDVDFYNQLTAPLFLALLALMSFVPLLNWTEFERKPFLRRMVIPSLVTLVVVFFGYFKATWSGPAVLAFAIGAFGIIAHIQDLVGKFTKRKFGAYLVHLGVLLILIGITGSSIFVDEIIVTVNPGDQVNFGKYTLKYQGLDVRYGKENYSVGTSLAITRDGRYQGELISEKTFWKDTRQPATKVGIYSTFQKDLYFNLAGWEQQEAQLHLQSFALVRWIWIGSFMMYLGVTIILWPVKIRKQRSR